MPDIILASKSKVRLHILNENNVVCSAKPSNVDEEEIKEIAEDTTTEIEEEGDGEGAAGGDAAGDAAGDAGDDAGGDAGDDAGGDAGDNSEPFMGGMKKKLNNLRKILKSNITDLDRELKVGAERRSISATKQ